MVWRFENIWKYTGLRIKCVYWYVTNMEGNLKSQFRKILPFWLLQKCPMHSLQEHTNVLNQFLQVLFKLTNFFYLAVSV